MPYKDPEEKRKHHAEYLRNRYNNDPDYRAKHLVLVKSNRRKYKQLVRNLIEVFRQGGCLVCGEDDTACLVAHHLDPSQKDFRIGRNGFAVYHPTQVAKELAKCVCLCENCHRKLHAGRFSLLPVPGAGIEPADSSL